MKFASDFRKQARDALRGNWLVAIIAGIIASFFGATTFGGGSFSVSSNSSGQGTVTGSLEVMLQEFLTSEAAEIALIALGFIALVSFIVALACLLVGGAIGVGYSKFNIDLIEGRKASIGTLFGSFKIFITALLARILRSVFTALWTLLFIIPGIMAHFSYSMVNFVLADNPDMDAMEALAESKRLMKGNKWRLFCLDLSFIGWAFLSFLTLGIGLIWLIPYQEAAYAAFYRDICPAKVAEPENVA